jgi:hypothetical protein
MSKKVVHEYLMNVDDPPSDWIMLRRDFYAKPDRCWIIVRWGSYWCGDGFQIVPLPSSQTKEFKDSTRWSLDEAESIVDGILNHEKDES